MILSYFNKNEEAKFTDRLTTIAPARLHRVVNPSDRSKRSDGFV